MADKKRKFSEVGKSYKENRKGIKMTKDKPRSDVPVQPQARKSKKPKHLKRKLAQAEKSQDTEALHALQAEQDKLDALKQAEAAKWLETCKSLVGPEKWDQVLFDKLVAAGTSKSKFITALGVDKSKSSSSLLPAPKKKKSSNSRGNRGDDRSGKPSSGKRRISGSSAGRDKKPREKKIPENR